MDEMNLTPSLTLDAEPAAPSLTLDPFAPVEEKKAEPVSVEETPLTPEEQKMVDDFAEKIDIRNSQQVLQYGAACQKKIGDFSDAALSKVRTKDMGQVGDMLADLVGEDLSADYIIPAAFDPRVKDAVAAAVKQAAYDSGVARI